MTSRAAAQALATGDAEHYPPRLRRRGLHSVVVSTLGLGIVRGDHPAGSILPRSEELAVQLGVSRTVVREGIRALAEKGLLVSRQRAGARVRPREDRDLVDPDVIGWLRQAGPDLGSSGT